MRKIIVISMISLDGVMQAPGGPKEDTSGGFEYGGWTAAFGDDEYFKIITEEMEPADYLLGRKTFEMWSNYWPKHADMWPSINTGTKYVVSRTMHSSDWSNSVFLDSLENITQLKESEGGDIHVWGSSQLVHGLLKHDLVDEIWLKTFPVTLGSGKKLFEDGAIPVAFKLIEGSITPSGIVIAHYKRDGDIVIGEVGE